MHTYHLTEWFMFLYIYCFLGWCFESAYVSMKNRKCVNRGFMKGPFLPIYGFGAITVLCTALPFQGQPVIVYFVGAFAATTLEYVTGVCMEALFQVRYWDYSKKRFQFQGHVCLGSTVAWGGISLAMIYGFHKPIEQFVFQMPEEWVTNAVMVMTIVVAADFATSFKTAMDIKAVLVKLEGIKVETRHLQQQVIGVEKLLLQKVNEKKDKEMHRMEEMLRDIRERLENLQLPEFPDKFQQYKEELLEFRDKYMQVKDQIKGYFAKDKLQMFRRNPSAASSKYKDVLEEYKKRMEQKASELKRKR